VYGVEGAQVGRTERAGGDQERSVEVDEGDAREHFACPAAFAGPEPGSPDGPR
jgi:hypothetical protein